MKVVLGVMNRYLLSIPKLIFQIFPSALNDLFLLFVVFADHEDGLSLWPFLFF